MTGVLVVGDLFRHSRDHDDKLQWDQQGNVRWLTRYLRAILAAAPAITVAALDPAPLWHAADDCRPAAGDDVHMWWAAKSIAPLAEPIAAMVQAAVDDQVVIGFELPPSLRAAIVPHARALIEIEIAPVRFLDDLMFSILSPDLDLMAAFEAARLSIRTMYWQAQLIRTSLADEADADWPWTGDDAVLVAAQTPHDRMLMIEDGFDRLDRHHDELAALAAAHTVLLVRPHPHMPDDIAGLRDLLAIPQLRITTANSYRLIASGRVRTVVSLSSSLLEEAPYFSVPPIRLMSARHADPLPAPVTISPVALAGKPAAAIARACGVTMPEPDWEPDATPDVLRRILRFDWARGGVAGRGPVLPAIQFDQIPPGGVSASDPRAVPGLIFGWHAPEVGHVWSMAIGTLAVAWPTGSDAAALVVTMTLATHPALGASKILEIWTAGACRTVEVIADAPPIAIDLTIERPASALPVQIHLATTAEPTPGDPRQLGVDLHWIAWRPLVATPVARRRRTRAGDPDAPVTRVQRHKQPVAPVADEPVA